MGGFDDFVLGLGVGEETDEDAGDGDLVDVGGALSDAEGDFHEGFDELVTYHWGFIIVEMGKWFMRE